MKKGLVIAALGLMLLSAVGYFGLNDSTPAPDLTVYALNGRVMDLKKLRGKPVLITFWATTCPACVKEIPHLSALYQELNPQGLEIIGIAMAYDPPSYVLRMTQQRQIPYPVALDPLGTMAQAFGDVQVTPSSFLISPQGRIVQHQLGAWNMDALRATLHTML
ncbi:MAG: TlpA family protein disulfide reductase [Gammaproteobacteria bacterium]|nr:TlpA family protein disulfide reductase [Gammaproteobacteria bacterium]MCP5423461.1 TlpA family protein disulfide reductase [Gammaproteobacteria bacterium]MCP5458782.1 TlpA family protein disulfide reductase [Gammaproteobacteria bacterium]